MPQESIFVSCGQNKSSIHLHNASSVSYAHIITYGSSHFWVYCVRALPRHWKCQQLQLFLSPSPALQHFHIKPASSQDRHLPRCPHGQEGLPPSTILRISAASGAGVDQQMRRTRGQTVGSGDSNDIAFRIQISFCGSDFRRTGCSSLGALTRGLCFGICFLLFLFFFSAQTH